MPEKKNLVKSGFFRFQIILSNFHLKKKRYFEPSCEHGDVLRGTSVGRVRELRPGSLLWNRIKSEEDLFNLGEAPNFIRRWFVLR